MIRDENEAGISVRRQCELLEVPRSTHYYRQKSLSRKAEGETSTSRDEALRERVETVARNTTPSTRPRPTFSTSSKQSTTLKDFTRPWATSRQ